MTDQPGAPGATLERLGRTAARVSEVTPLEADLLVSEAAYLVVTDAPGARPADVSVSAADGTLRVRVDRFREFREDSEMRYPGRGLSFSGEVDLPEDADPTRADATLKPDGTLHVRLPRTGDGTDDGGSGVTVEDGG
jgi:HSP20 family molecular chaperone IbpA